MKTLNIVQNLKTILFCLLFWSYAHAHAMLDKADNSHNAQNQIAKSIPYTKKDFLNAQKQGKHIVIDVWKLGCPTCKAQKPTLEKAREKFPNAIFMKVDFDKQKNIVQKFNVIKQSTIIVFKGKEETGRVLGETDESKLLALIQTGA